MERDSLPWKILAWSAYPGVMLLGIALQQLMLESELGLEVSSYLPIIIGVSLITALEYLIPYREAWRPKMAEVKADVLFTLLIQILLPKFLALLLVLLFIDHATSGQDTVNGLWVHDWPLAVQVVLMMVLAEFMRYWVHRAAHNWSFLWRLHAVHHSPDKLYWLNTGRFHPIEKAIQFMFDTFPFILLGVSPEVVSVYFVFYAINGFYQHSNVDLRMGPLNYVISSAQLHRWHHSVDIEESGSNFGNNLIIWDLVFGSWFLPANRQVDELGLINRSYPMSFLDQMKTPFTAGIDKSGMAILGLRGVLRNLQMRIGILGAWLFYKLPFEKSLSNPMKYQHQLLRQIIQANRDTEYGKEHQFDAVTSYSDYVKAVPVQHYEDLRAYIEQQEKTQHPFLTTTQPVYYAVTSGTTGQPKYIPVLPQTIRQHQRALAIFSCALSQSKRHAFTGELLAIPGAYKEGEMPGGSTYGSISGLLYYLMPKYLQEKYVVPNEVFGILDHELKYRLIIRLAIQHPEITYIVTANPSTLLKLIDMINEDVDSIANDVQTGRFSHMDALPESIAALVEKYLVSDPERAVALRGMADSSNRISFSDIWPNLRLLVTWMGGSCGVAINSLKKILSSTTRIVELGYLSSELRGTITLEDTGTAGALTFHDNFYEFVDVDQYGTGEYDVLTLDKIKVGKQYYIVVTTCAGLYRYFMNDVIEVNGIKNKTPLISFVRKGRGVTNITGEKLSENQLMMAIDKVNETLEIDIPFYIALTSVADSHYILYLEAEVDSDRYASLLDDQIRALNTEYASKRDSGRLGIMVVRSLRAGTGDLYKAHEVNKGVRESQFKPPILQNETDCSFPFENHVG